MRPLSRVLTVQVRRALIRERASCFVGLSDHPSQENAILHAGRGGKLLVVPLVVVFIPALYRTPIARFAPPADWPICDFSETRAAAAAVHNKREQVAPHAKNFICSLFSFFFSSSSFFNENKSKEKKTKNKKNCSPSLENDTFVFSSYSTRY